MENSRMGRALDLSGLQNSEKSVTLGFTVDGKTKYVLAQEAKSRYLTLSSYMQYLVKNRHGDLSEEFKERLIDLEELNQCLIDEANAAEYELSKYSIPKFDLLYNLKKGQFMQYVDEHGLNKQRKINTKIDLFEVILELVII